MRLNYNSQNNTGDDTSNHVWTIEDNYTFLQTYDLHETLSEVDRNVTLTCDMKDIFMHYGMLLAALANAFISLLTFIIQCNLNAACVKKRCVNVIKSLDNTRVEPQDAEAKSRGSKKKSVFLRDNIKVKTKSNVVQRFAKISKFRMLKDKKPTTFLITSHWLVPFLVVGILYFAEYSDMNDVKHTEDIKCMFESNFPMTGFDENLNNVDSVAHMTPLRYNYFSEENLSNDLKPNDVEIDDVVSKVQSIVKTALNYKRNSTKDIEAASFLNTGPKNWTDYILPHNIMEILKNTTNIYKDSKIPLFYDTSKNTNSSTVPRVSVEKENGNYQEDSQTYFTSTESTTEVANTTFVQNVTFVSNDQIYSEIMKRIQTARTHSAKNHSVNRLRDKDQLKINNLKDYVVKRKPNSIKGLLSSDRYINPKVKQSSLLRMANECFVSTKFLKLQLFVLSFLIYFLSILLSCVLQMRGKHMCKNALALLKSKVNRPFADGKTRLQDSIEGSGTSQGGNDRGETDTNAIQTNHETCKENDNIALEINCMMRMLNVLKLSLVLCILLWTPVFVGTLLRVYSCIRAPQWLTDTTFVTAISFGIIRNALNINIIKIQEACNDLNTRENKVHPVE
ncbi:hypothetical protein PUN28_000819 [Cardiocondyla obscurior]|uniref:Uncharacterized protein n=1 Tax=Cardiocondyla obscurior TaxID=286306 RepID=A0AAW2H185_9HYME